MHFKCVSLPWLLAVSTLLVLNSIALANNSVIYSDNVLKFELNPLVCMVEKIGDECYLEANVHWQTKQLMNICILQKNIIVQCWDNKQDIQDKLAFYLTDSTKIYMMDHNKIKLASVAVDVNASKPKKQRRRLQSAWGIF